MKSSLITQIEADRLGPRAEEIALEKADQLESEGDAEAAQRWRDKAKAFREYFDALVAESRRKAGIDPSRVKLHAGIAGLSVAEPINITSGLTLSPTYAHVMAPFIMAFTRVEPGRSHPGPWKNATGGSSVDLHAMLSLERDASIGGLDRLASIWFATALLRLRVSNSIRVPVISDTAFDDVSEVDEPMLWSAEFGRPVHPVLHHGSVAKPKNLEWIVQNLGSGSELMRIEGFSLAFRTFDQAWFSESLSAAMVLIWSAIEALFRPGSRNITKTLSRMIATYLTADVQARDRNYQEIKKLYEVRGNMVHAAHTPDVESFKGTAEIARSAFIRAIENGEVPDQMRLQKAWSERTAY